METITLAAPAKINLSLRILGKRPDGFHELETLMIQIGLADEIEIVHAPGHGIPLTCNDPEIPTDSGNLCVRAVELFREETGIAHGISISLMKRIPHGAGLGGGSSDAAAVLKGINTLFDEPLVAEELALLAASLGSDVPFFLHDGPAVCRGRGELLGEAPAIPERRILLIKPPFPVPTAWAYKRHAEIKEAGTKLPVDPIQHLGPIELVNDLEPPVFAKYLLLPAMKQWLLEQSAVESAFMTGSGSTMVAVINPTAGVDDIPVLKRAITAEFGETIWVCDTGWGMGDRE
jgi:4-diphosphocytidyl-2-C-methyl-D-erythritol kinase